MLAPLRNRLSNLLNVARTETPRPPEVPPGTRVYCVGDIHGRDDLLEQVHRSIQEDAENFQGRKVAVYVGDYIDRGLQSKDVVDRLVRRPLKGFENIFLMGNHEESLLVFLRQPETGPGWLSFGGQATLYSYGVKAEGIPAGKKMLKQLRDALESAIPEEHLAFFRQLRPSHVEGDYFFVHAGVRPGLSLKRQRPEDMFWIREEFIGSDVRHEKMIVHGHTVTDEPEVLPNRIGIDTGAYASGQLTCLVLEGTDWRFL